MTARTGTLAARAGVAGVAPRSQSLPVYVQCQGARIGKDGDLLSIHAGDGGSASARMAEISQLVLFGNVSVTTPCLHDLMRRGIPVSWHTGSGWFLGHTVGLSKRDPAVRIGQYRAQENADLALEFARGFVAAKIANCRARASRWEHARLLGTPTARLARLRRRAETAGDIDTLRGIEGAAAKAYYEAFADALAPPKASETATFRFRKRVRRPPTDPINAMLSFSSALLLRTFLVAVEGAGLDPMLGFLHASMPGRPALALDAMEPFRPLIADSAVVAAVNVGAVSASDFEYSQTDADGEPDSKGGVRLRDPARRALISAFERRLDRVVTPDHLGYSLTLRRLIAVQAHLLAQALAKGQTDVAHYVSR